MPLEIQEITTNCTLLIKTFIFLKHEWFSWMWHRWHKAQNILISNMTNYSYLTSLPPCAKAPNEAVKIWRKENSFPVFGSSTTISLAACRASFRVTCVSFTPKMHCLICSFHVNVCLSTTAGARSSLLVPTAAVVVRRTTCSSWEIPLDKEKALKINVGLLEWWFNLIQMAWVSQCADCAVVWHTRVLI